MAATLYSQIDYLEDLVDEKGRELQEKETIIKEQKEIIAYLKSQNAVEGNAYDDLKKSHDDLKIQLEKYKDKLNFVEKAEKCFMDTISDLNGIIEQQSLDVEKTKQLHNEKKILEDENSMLINKIADLDNVLSKNKSQIATYEDVIKNLENELQNIKEHVMPGRKSLSFMNYSVGNDSILDLKNMSVPEFGETVADMKINSMENEIQKIMTEKSDLIEKLQQSEQKEKDLQKCLTIAQDDLDVAKNEIDSLKTSLLYEHKASSELKQRMLDFEKTKNFCDHLQTECKSLEEMITILKTENHLLADKANQGKELLKKSIENVFENVQNKLQSSIAGLENKIDALKVKLDQTNIVLNNTRIFKENCITNLQEKLRQSSVKLEQSLRLSEQKSQQLAAIKKLIDELEKVKNSHEDLKTNYESYVQQLETEIASKCKQLNIEFDQQLQALSILSHFKHTLEVQLEDSNQKFHENQQKLCQAQTTIEIMKKEINEYSVLYDKSRVEIAELRELVDEMGRRKSGNVQNDVLKLENENLKKQMITLENAVKKNESKIKKFIKDLEIEKQSFAMERKTKERLLKENSELEMEIRNSRKKIQELEAEQKSKKNDVHQEQIFKLKSEPVSEQNLLTSSEQRINVKNIKAEIHHSCRLPKGTGCKFEMADEEGQFMDPNPIKISSEQSMVEQSPFPDSRIKQLIDRNKRLQPHLRSTYPLETQHLQLDENTVRSGSTDYSMHDGRSTLSSIENEIPAKKYKSDGGDETIVTKERRSNSFKNITPVKLIRKVLSSRNKTWSPKH